MFDTSSILLRRKDRRLYEINSLGFRRILQGNCSLLLNKSKYVSKVFKGYQPVFRKIKKETAFSRQPLPAIKFQEAIYLLLSTEGLLYHYPAKTLQCKHPDDNDLPTE